MRIICVEPQCSGYTHVPFNSAFLVTLRKAFPQDEIQFWGEKKHVEYLQDYLAYFDISERIVKWQHLQPLSGKHVSLQLGGWVNLLTEIRHLQPDVVIFTSLDGVGLSLLKFISSVLQISHRRMIIILHTVATNVADSSHVKSIIFRSTLQFLNYKSNLSYVVLSPVARDNIIQIVPDVKEYLECIHHPYLMCATDGKAQQIPTQGPLVFGFLGTTILGKGYELFVELIKDVSRSLEVDETMFPVINYASLLKYKAKHSVSATKDLIQRYHELIQNVHFAIFPYSSQRYTFTASGAFLDAVANARPCIVLKTPLFIDYFDKMGNIGYMCEDYPDLLHTVTSLLRDFPLSVYREQQQNIIRGRAMFEPTTIAPNLREIITRGKRKIAQ